MADVRAKRFLCPRRAFAALAGSAAFLTVAFAAQCQQLPFTQSFDQTTNKIMVGLTQCWGIFRESEPIKIKTIDGSGIRVFNLRGTTVYQGAPGKLPALPVDHYFVECGHDRAAFVVLPNDKVGAPFLGIEADVGNNPDYSKLVDRIPSSLMRLGDPIYWGTVEPRPRWWDWTAADRVVDLNFSKGRRIIAMAFIRPQWLTNDADFLPHYLEYLKGMARRYRGKLFAIEIWNEPWTTYDLWGRLPNLDTLNLPMTDWRQMVRSYTTILQKARETIKKVDSRILVIGPDWVNATTYYDVTKRLVDLGGQNLLDVFTYHDYDDGRFPPDADTPWKRTYVDRLEKRILNFHSILKRPDLPIFVDEIGLYGRSALGARNTGDESYNSELTWYRGMCRAIKYVVMYRAAGVNGLIPHVFVMGTSDPKRNLEIYGWEFRWRGPHPKTSAFLMTCYRLKDAKLIDQRIVREKIFLYAWLTGKGSRFVLAWNLEGYSCGLKADGRFQIKDIFGRPSNGRLGEEPLLIEVNPSVSTTSTLDIVSNALTESTKN